MNRLPTMREAGLSLNAMRPRHRVENALGDNVSEGFYAAFSAGTSPLAAKVNEVTALGVSTVFACLDYISRIFSTLPIELYRRTNDGREVAENNPVRNLIKTRPNPVMTPADFAGCMAYNQTLHGECFAQIVNNRAGVPVELWPMPAPSVSVNWRREDRFPSYVYDGKTLDFSQVLHIKGMSRNGVAGLKTLSLVSGIIGLAQALDRNASGFFGNGSRPGMVYTLPPEVRMTEPQIDALRGQLRAAHEGVENAFKTMLVTGGGKVEFLRSSNEASQFDEIAYQTQIAICQVFGVPPHKVQLLKQATFSNIEQQQVQAIVDLFQPLCVRWEQALGGALLGGAEIRNHFFKFNLNAFARGDFATRQAGYATGIQNGYFTRNEVRGWEDMNPIDDGDIAVANGTLVPILAAAPPPISAAA